MEKKKKSLKPYKIKTDDKFYHPMKFILTPIAKLLFRPKFINKEVLNKQKNKKTIILSNHRYNLDPIMICMSTDKTVHFLGKLEIMNAFLIKHLLRHVGIIPVDRTKKSPEVFQVVKEYLDNNEFVALFPEGTRNKKLNETKLLDFKYGAAKMAIDNDAEVVIAVQKGKFNVINNEGLTIKFSEPIKLEKDVVKATEKIRKTMLEMLEDF